MDVTVIDDADFAGAIASALHSGEISTSKTVSSTVRRILRHIGHRKMSSLTIMYHGETSSDHLEFQIGNEWVMMSTIATYSAQLSRLKGKFTNQGYLELKACEIGHNQPLLLQVSKKSSAFLYTHIRAPTRYWMAIWTTCTCVSRWAG